MYRDGIRYAVNPLGTLGNTYLYVDASNSAWMGRDSNFNATVLFYDQVLAAGTGGPGYDKIHGLATNIANYVPTGGFFLPNVNLPVGRFPILQKRWIDWNPRIDERDYATALQSALVVRGCTGCGILIDTARNGWGGQARPPTLSTSFDPNSYVDQSRLDRRLHRTNWCNQVGAGVGVRPTADTGITGVDAFIWAKPPGESDGTGTPGIIDEDDRSSASIPRAIPCSTTATTTTWPRARCPTGHTSGAGSRHSSKCWYATSIRRSASPWWARVLAPGQRPARRARGSSPRNQQVFS